MRPILVLRLCFKWPPTAPQFAIRIRLRIMKLISVTWKCFESFFLIISMCQLIACRNEIFRVIITGLIMFGCGRNWRFRCSGMCRCVVGRAVPDFSKNFSAFMVSQYDEKRRELRAQRHKVTSRKTESSSVLLWDPHISLTYVYSVEQSPSWEANRFSVVKKLAGILWNSKVHYRIDNARRPSLSWDRSIQSMPPSHFLNIRLNIILPSTSGSSKWYLSLRFPHQNPVYTSPLPHTRYMPRLSNFFRFDHMKNIGWGVQIIKLLIM